MSARFYYEKMRLLLMVFEGNKIRYITAPACAQQRSGYETAKIRAHSPKP